MSSAVTEVNGAVETKPPLIEQLRANPRLPVMIGGAVAVAAATAFWLWSRAPDYRVLYSNLSDRDGGAIIASLQQMNIPYKFAEGGGAVMVPADKAPEARLRLASQGLPKGGAVGFELMDNQKFGVSQFAEQVNYQRALEGELARSIESISAVESARIHLALPKPSLFVRDQQKPSASVVLTLRRGRSLDDGQVSAVVHLISSSVPELNPRNITVVDQGGNLLSTPNAGSRGLDASQLKYAQEIERSYIERIETILQPILGAANVRAQVAADIDFSTAENTEEKYRPNQEPGSAAIRSQQSSDSSQQSTGAPGGVPGALSNQPPANPVAPIAVAGQPAANGQPAQANGQPNNQLNSQAARPASAGNMRKDVTTNYELDRSIRHVQQGAGGIKRLSVAVVVNHRGARDAQGKLVTKPLSEAELDQVRNLVKEAMGYKADRGDSLNVVSSQFAPAGADEPILPWWKQPDNITLAKAGARYLLLGMLALFLWFAVLRPLLRKHLGPPPEIAPPPQLEGNEPAVAALAQEQGEADTKLLETETHKKNVEHAQETARKDPRLVAMVLRHWMNSND